MWLAEKADGSLNQSQRVCESWQTDCELGEMKVEQKWCTWRGLRSSEWNTGWPGKLLEVHHLRFQENTRVPTHAHTATSPFILPLAVPGLLWGAGLLSGWGSWKVSVTPALCRYYSRSIPGIASTHGTEAAFICTIFSPFPCIHTRKCLRSQDGTQNTLQRWSTKAEVVSTFTLLVKSSLSWCQVH